MNLVQSLTRAVARLNRQLLCRLLSVGLPRYGKRMLFVVGLCYWLRGRQQLDHETLQVINEHLKLASCPEALEFPALVSSHFWESELGLPKDHKEAVVCGANLVESMPAWIRYASPEKILVDIMEVMRLVRPVTA